MFGEPSLPFLLLSQVLNTRTCTAPSPRKCSACSKPRCGISELAFGSAARELVRLLGADLADSPCARPTISDLFDWMLNDDNTSIATTQGPADDAALDADINAVLTGPKAPGVVRVSFRSGSTSEAKESRAATDLAATRAHQPLRLGLHAQLRQHSRQRLGCQVSLARLRPCFGSR